MKLVIRSNRKIEYENLLFCYVLALPCFINLYTKTIRLFIGNTHKLDTLAVYGILVLLLVKAWGKLGGQIRLKEAMVCIGFGVTILISMLSPIANQTIFLSVITEIFRSCLIAYLVGRAVNMNDNLLRYLRIASYVMILSVMADMLLFSSGSLADIYSQYSGYMLYDGFMLLLTPMLLQHRWTDYFFAVLVVGASLLTGARGPFLLVILAWIFGVVLIGKDKKHLFLTITLIITVSTLCIVYLEGIVAFFAKIAEKQNFSMRTINLINSGELISYLSGRDKLFSISINFICEHILLGCGLLNDRVIIGQEMNGNLMEAVGYYPHNIALEMCMQFGLVGGSVLLIILIQLIVRKYKKQKTIQGKLFTLSLVFAGLCPLMISGSYVSSNMFYCLIGYSMSSVSDRR